MSLQDSLRQRIEADGPLRFRDWMDACLYDASSGYYMGPGRKTGAGEDADFATSPTLHPFLAQCIGKDVAATWSEAGEPAQFTVVEFGGGEGDLARDALAFLDDTHPELAGLVQWIHIEMSPTHRAAQLGDARVQHADAPPMVDHGVAVAHEFLDALPFHWLERRKGNWAEVAVKADGEAFAETYVIPTPAAIDAAPPTPEDGWPEDQRVAAMADAKAWIQGLPTWLKNGKALVVDYGAGAVWRHGQDGTVRTFRQHQDGGSPLEEPGSKDITASVDFQATATWAAAVGMTSTTTSQEEWLLAHGILDALNATKRDSEAGASQYLRLRQLLLPTGLGRAFMVQSLTLGST